MENQTVKKKSTSRNINLKILAIAALFIAFLLPKFAILNLVSERQYMEEEAYRKVAQQYGSDLKIQTPKIAIPYKETKTNPQTGNEYVEHKLFILEANACDAKIDADVSTLKKGIYDIPVCQSISEITYDFDAIDFSKIEEKKENFIWEDAALFIQLKDSRGIIEKPLLNTEAKTSEVKPGIGFPTQNKLNGFHAKLIDYKGEKNQGIFQLKLKGTNGIFFNSSALNFDLRLESNWPHPNFQGKYANYAPHSREVNNDGFTANWKSNEFNFNVNQYAVATYSLHQAAYVFRPSNGSVMGAEFMKGSSHYKKTERSVKYMFLVVGLVFAAFFITEILSKKRQHVIQYILIGFAIAIFFLLLLALSEYLGFNIAYLSASFVTSALIGLYATTIYSKKKTAIFLFTFLLVIFGFLYVVIGAMEAALLLGTITLFVLLAVTMYVTRRINWYDTTS